MDFRTGKKKLFHTHEKYGIIQLYPNISYRLESSYKGAKYGREKNKAIFTYQNTKRYK